MAEKPKRLAPTRETLRELFLKSGNLCAFPNCPNLMMNAEGIFIGNLCHIEAAEKGGPRFNSGMTNEHRRQPANLLLMCHEHHVVTDDESKYTVNKLSDIKNKHERRFSRPDRAILDKLTDWTTLDKPTGVKNLRRLNSELNLELKKDELAACVEELNLYIRKLKGVPIEVRRFVGAASKRIHLMRRSDAVAQGEFGYIILARDIEMAFHLNKSTVKDKIVELDSYKLGCLDEFDTELGVQPAIRIDALPSGWTIWMDIVRFCKKTATPIEDFTEELDFSSLDD